MKKGLYVVAWYDTLVIAPPLIITEAEVNEAMEILDQSLEIADGETEKSNLSFSKSSEYKNQRRDG